MAVSIAIVGGKLQGTEAVYLAKKAGFITILIDKNPDAPASGFCDEFLVHEFKGNDRFPVLKTIDLILPAIENDAVLADIRTWAESTGIPLAFDPVAYAVSSSKIKSDALFEQLNLPGPRYWPDCVFPVVVKPDQASGSLWVEIFNEEKLFLEKFPDPGGLKNTVIQEYLEGPSYSIEVMGEPGRYLPLQVTDLGMDSVYDCNRVDAPTVLSDGRIREMEVMAVKIAEAIRLKGIMDLEVILHQGELKPLEIDARLPSQTPMAVFHSTGLNMVAMLADLFLGNPVRGSGAGQTPALIEHIRVSGAQIEFLGEHIMGEDGPLHWEIDFFGADEAVTSYLNGKSHWVATLVFTAPTIDDIFQKRTRCLDRIVAIHHP